MKDKVTQTILLSSPNTERVFYSTKVDLMHAFPFGGVHMVLYDPAP